MTRPVTVANAIRDLRRLRGWTLADLAGEAGIEPADVQAIEAGRPQPAAMDALLDLFGIDGAGFDNKSVQPVAQPDPAVFLFRGNYVDLSFADLEVLRTSLDEGRSWVEAHGQGRKGLALRSSFRPEVADPGPNAAAALQGYRLARHVRVALELGVEAVGDLREIIEDRLGAVVRVAGLSTGEIVAAGVLDVDRAGAAVVLGAEDKHRASNPLLARVYLAHELCHLLFDPVGAGRVQISLDREAAHSEDSAYERRARAFAAELLIPTAGLDALAEKLGWNPYKPDAAARRWVDAVSGAFKTPWEIALWQSFNQGFVTRVQKDDLLERLRSDAGYSAVPLLPVTTLPAVGQPALCLGQRVAEPSESLARRAWRTAQEEATRVQGAAHERARKVIDEIVADAETLNERALTDILALRADDLLVEHQFNVVDAILRCIDPERLPPTAMTGLLMVTRAADIALQEARDDFFARAKPVLTTRWGWDSNRIARLGARLR